MPRSLRAVFSRRKEIISPEGTRPAPSRMTFQRLRAVRVAAIAIAAAAFCGYLDFYPKTFSALNRGAYDERLKMAGQLNPQLTDEALARVAVVTLSDFSFNKTNPDRLPGPPLPRAYYATLIGELTRDGAKVIAFDILFDKQRAGDAAFAHAMRRSGRVLLACEDVAPAKPSINPPEPLLRRAAYLGHTGILGDSEFDRIQPVVVDRGEPMPAFSVQAARMALGVADQPVPWAGDDWQFAGHKVPLDANGTFRVRYFDAAGKTFGHLPFEEVIRKPELFRDSFRNKVVVIGYTLTTSKETDQHPTPLGQKWGVEIHAQAIATLLLGKGVRAATPRAEVGTLATLTFTAALLASLWRLKRAALVLVLLLPAYYGFNLWLFVARDVDLPLVAPSAAVVLTALGVLLERGLTEEQEKTRMRGLLHRYVSPQIAEHVLQHPELLGRTGKRATGTVLFSDIRGFTALSEQMSPEELVSRMNEYFQAMTEIVFRHEGTAASMVGDAMLALFGVPVPYPDHARRAVAAAVEMQDTLRALQERWRAQGQTGFDIGIGINTGEMVVGEVGGQHLTNFTVYGLQVNIASRVEGLNKDLGTRILITRTTYQSVAGEIEARGPLRVPVKGVEEAVEVFEVLGWKCGQEDQTQR